MTRPFQRVLLRWYRGHKRDMPWRRTRDPYRIWVSEVMLQQTRVAAVLPYYLRFVRRFPTVKSLARAQPEVVLRMWAGLGYYGRARNLHRAAKEIVAQHNGRFPPELDAALTLPGVGRYTAAAVLSMAYGAPLAVLDGNVARVLARLDAVGGDLRTGRRWRKLDLRAQQLLDSAAPADWNQAMMELGATVCTPRAPHCGECPLARWCKAYKLGIAEQLPASRRKPAPVKVTVAAAVLLDARARTMLVRQNGGLFSGMWQFPAVEAQRDGRGELAKHLRTVIGAYGHAPLQPLSAARHSVTFRNLTLEPYLLWVTQLPRLTGARIVPLVRIGRLPISSATRKIARQAREFLLRAASAPGS